MDYATRLVDSVELGLGPLDALRRAVFRVGAPVLAPYLSARPTRIAWLSVFVVGSSLALALAVPLPLLALGPLVLGVPHLVADVRYLVVRPGLHRRPGAWGVAACLAVAALSQDLAPALLAPVPAALAAAGAPLGRRLLGAAPWVAAAALAFVFRSPAAFAVAQGHNFVAVAVWLLVGAALHAGEGRGRRWFLGLHAAVAAGFVLGVFDPVLAVTRSLHLPGAEGWSDHAATVAPVPDPVLRLRLVALFAYAQSVHYGLWLRVVPEECRPRPATRSWRSGFRALRDDVGDPFLAAALLATLAFVVAGAVDLTAARHTYLGVAFFHGPLEFAVLTAWFVDRRVAAA